MIYCVAERPGGWIWILLLQGQMSRGFGYRRESLIVVAGKLDMRVYLSSDPSKLGKLKCIFFSSFRGF